MTITAAGPPPQATRLPTEDDLPCSDGIPMETHRHVLQMELLRQTLSLYWEGRREFFAGGNMFLYFSAEKLLDRDFRGPDFFVVLDTSARARKSWVVWQEGKGPDLVIELLSESTAQIDKTVKKQVCQDEVRVPEYFWYDPDTAELAGFALREGVYEPIQPDAEGRLPCRRLGLMLVRWAGSFEREDAVWLRWATPEGVLLPTPRENLEEQQRRAEEQQRRAEEQQRRAEEQQRRAEEQQRRAERLAERLRALGVDPNE